MYIPTIPTFSLDSSLCWCSCLKMMVLEGMAFFGQSVDLVT